jgi:hypothetical protein
LHGPIGNESFHPNAFGHQLMENKILSATHNLTEPMPSANPSLTLPSSDGLEILNAARSGRAIKTIEYDPSLSDDLAFRQTPIDISISGAEHALAPSTVLSAEIHSDPVPLGQFRTDNSGNLTAQITIPASLPTGYHSLHFYAKDLSGQNIDIYKDLYIASSADDLDGNGIADSAQNCIGIDASGQDYDRDGIDDACDAEITQPNPHAQSASLDGSITSKTETLAASDGRAKHTGSDSSISVHTAANTQTAAPKVLAAETTRPSQVISNQSSMRLPAKYALYGLGLVLLCSFLLWTF